MRSTVHGAGDAAVWDVAYPDRPSRMAGVAFAGFCRGETAADHRLVPHASVIVALDFGAGPSIVEDAAGGRFQGSLVGGLGYSGSVRVRGENIACVQVRLSPVVARAVLDVGPADLGGAVVRLDDLWGRRASLISERLSETSSWDDRFALVETLLADRYEDRAAADPEVVRAWDRIVAARGRLRVETLAAELGWSRKRLWARFAAQIGLPPKRAAKLVRFDRAAHRLSAGQDAARVAADGGYTDQSHLHRDVMAFAGVTPATLAEESRRTTAALAEPAGPLRRPARGGSASGNAGRAVVARPGPAWAMCAQ
ncbi:helix-turn-helix domain-containing protein [Actinomadura nitritigenes]|uniref:Helix-turn-helix transcriptional regulator n=1 Tax=Actinomadura nitritigenes TaxID=134602 RepID=A0ABS3QQP5_9ACTN|nr:helix-turn-helix domain-containing protein [Actinomadura nitritigenes]MBO2436305.1 helix-turn-helix transcriptional regulator [Actinomadura nitritigenes]